jgi:hypothetical protein
MVQWCLKRGTSEVHSYDHKLVMYLQTTFLLLDLIALATANQFLQFLDMFLKVYLTTYLCPQIIFICKNAPTGG